MKQPARGIVASATKTETEGYPCLCKRNDRAMGSGVFYGDDIWITHIYQKL